MSNSDAESPPDDPDGIMRKAILYGAGALLLGAAAAGGIYLTGRNVTPLPESHYDEDRGKMLYRQALSEELSRLSGVLTHTNHDVNKGCTVILFSDIIQHATEVDLEFARLSLRQQGTTFARLCNANWANELTDKKVIDNYLQQGTLLSPPQVGMVVIVDNGKETTRFTPSDGKELKNKLEALLQSQR